MKLILTFLLSFSTLADFTSFLEVRDASGCQSYSSCEDIDLHGESSKEHEKDGHQHHCHCHVGHSHAALSYFFEDLAGPILEIENSKVFFFDIGKTENYQFDLIRPPIV